LRDIKIITRDTIPCWYELSWRGEQGIILRIHEDFVNKKGPISEDAPIVDGIKEQFNFVKFSGEFGKNFGFEDSLKFLGEKDKFLEYLVSTPLVRKLEGKCSRCDGSGKNEDNWEGKCQYCDGEGKNIRYDYTEAFAVSATLTTIFEYVWYPEFETSCKLPQLMTISTGTQKGMNSSPIQGEYSCEAVRWMKMRGAGYIPEMVSAMKSAWEKMDGKLKDFDQFSFRADLADTVGWLCTSCPGDACGLHPDHHASYDIARGKGYKFFCHNTDHPMQQLTLLASLAALHDLMRRDAKIL
jgi:hypothetical protein